MVQPLLRELGQKLIAFSTLLPDKQKLLAPRLLRTNPYADRKKANLQVALRRDRRQRKEKFKAKFGTKLEKFFVEKVWVT